MVQQYYIRNEHNTIDYLMSFWTKNGSGYTCDINNAQKFTAEEADAIINGEDFKYLDSGFMYLQNITEFHNKISIDHLVYS